MLAPLRIPPCWTVSVALSKRLIKEIGPDARPLVLLTFAPLLRRFEKLKPVPPPLLWISICFLIASHMLSMESSIPMTKQAASWPCGAGRPAFIMVGLLGRNRSFAIKS